MLKVLVFTGYYLPGFKGGGPVKTIKNLIENTHDKISYKLITSDRDLGDTESYSGINLNNWNNVGNAQVYYISSGITGIKEILFLMKKNDYDIVYLNSFLSIKFSLLPLIIARTLSKKIILSPRGEFSEGALSIKPFRKKAYIAAYKLLKINKQITFQASSDYEKTDIIKALGTGNDIFIATNISSQEYAKKLTPKRSNLLNLVFISRVSPKKNIIHALKALNLVKENVRYHIYGPIEDNIYWAKCLDIIKELPPNITVEYMGEIHPSEVINTLSTYDLFFFPTQGENYGHVIAEALSAGLPLLISDTTPWRNLEQSGLGWDLPLNNFKSFSYVISKVANMPIDEHIQMRRKILNWATYKFNQDDAINANIDMFTYVHHVN